MELNSQDPQVLSYSEKWMRSIAEGIERIGGAAITRAELAAQESEKLLAENSDGGLWMRFFAGKSGEQAFLISVEDAIRLVQSLAGKSAEAQPALSEANRESLMGFFQQLATTVPVPGVGAELEFSGYERPTWPLASLTSVRFSTAQNSLCVVHELMSEDFVGALAPDSVIPPATVGPVLSSPLPNSNLDILMDVDLEVTLRFGQKQMLLRDVLNVGPGSVIELDQQVHQPVELVVGRRVVAWGEVVAVDGNYGLRITSIASQRERLESLAR